MKKIFGCSDIGVCGDFFTAEVNQDFCVILRRRHYVLSLVSGKEVPFIDEESIDNKYLTGQRQYLEVRTLSNFEYRRGTIYVPDYGEIFLAALESFKEIKTEEKKFYFTFHAESKWWGLKKIRYFVFARQTEWNAEDEE